MAHFAEINEDNIVVRVIVADQSFIDSGAVGVPNKWVKTSYNTYGGVHRLGGTPLRKNYAGIGYAYDPDRDAFIPPKTYDSWVLDEQKCQWKAPKDIPKAKPAEAYRWNETRRDWDLKQTP